MAGLSGYRIRIAFWMNSPSPITGDAYIIHKGTHANIPDDAIRNGKWFGIQMKDEEVFKEFRFAVDDDIVKSVLIVDVYEFITEEWIHVVAIRDISEGKLKLYLHPLPLVDRMKRTYQKLFPPRTKLELLHS